MWSVLLVCLILAGIWVCAVAPGRSRAKQCAPFLGRTFAHRGLYTKNQSVPENSLPAFLAAVEAGYGVELDVQLTSDGQIVVFHDDSLERVCGVSGRVGDYTLAQLQRFSLFDTHQRIPFFTDVLEVLGGRVPVIIELKAGGDWRALCEKTRDALRGYRGDVCVESFHPLLVRWFRRHAPEFLRGQLSEAYRFSRRFLPWYSALMMSRLFCNFLTHPQFLAYRIGPKCLSVRIAEWLGAMRVSWTARPGDDWAKLTRTSDCIIFEHCRPATHFQKSGTAVPLLLELDIEPIIKPPEHVTVATRKGS